jgi:hypothetical protein
VALLFSEKNPACFTLEAVSFLSFSQKTSIERKTRKNALALTDADKPGSQTRKNALALIGVQR